MKPTVLLADDHQIFLDGLRGLLDPHYEVVGEANDGEALVRLALEKRPDLIVSDISMPGMSGLKALRELAGKGLRSRVIIVTMHTEPEFAAEAIDAGAAGYVLKNSATAELLTAMSEALGGGVYITPRLAREVLELSRSPVKGTELTERHRDILNLLAQGLVAKEIGDRLDISPRTVEYHKYQLMKKLGFKTTAELIQFAVKEHIVEEA